MELKLNGLYTPSRRITFNHIPTIVTIDSETTEAARDVITVYVTSVSPESDFFNDIESYTTRINGYSISYTTDETKAVNNVAYITPIQGTSYYRGMAYHLVRALKNTPLGNEFDITYDWDSVSYGGKQCIPVYIRPKNWGKKEIEVATDFATWETTITQERMGSSVGGSDWNDDELYNSKVILELSIEEDEEKQSTVGSSGKDIPLTCQLEKTYHKNGISFDIAPLLSNYTDNGKVTEYNIRASYIKDGQLSLIGEINHNYCVNGYSVNQGAYYIEGLGYADCVLAQNISRGETKEDATNSTTLYYNPDDTIVLSLYSKNLRPFSYDIVYLDSAKNVIGTQRETYEPQATLGMLEVVPDEDDRTYYIQVVLPSIGTIEYKNVKPLKYGNRSNYQTIYWYNSYGGVSFFPFTASRTEEREVERETYKKNAFDIYDHTDHRKLEMVYSNEMEYKVTLKSHYIEKDGIYSIYDLMNSYEAYTFVGGIKYDIIVDEMSIEEINNNGVYQVTLTYKYSSNDMF